jgi:hypothetical protein
MLSGLLSLLYLASCSGGPDISAAHPLAKAATTPTSRGSIYLVWAPGDKSLIVKIDMLGLTPGSLHPAHIHTGSCAHSGRVLYALANLKADANGAASVTTTIEHVPGGIPASGWSINIHQGPTMSSHNGAAVIACANISNPNPSPMHTQSLFAALT